MKQLYYEKGILELLGEKGSIMPIDSFVLFLELFIKKEGIESKRLLETYGENLADKYFKKIDVNNKNPLLKLKTSLNILSLLGLGESKIIRFNENQAIISIDSSVAKEYKKLFGSKKEGVDHLIKGILKRIFKNILNKNTKIIEKECIVMGKTNCIFDIKFL